MEKECPTPKNSPLPRKLENLLGSNDGGQKGSSINFSTAFQEKILALLSSSSPARNSEAENDEMWFFKLRSDPTARSRLENVHAARSHKYGSAHFGPKNWYKEAVAVAKKLKSQADRRKFRHGLKGDLEFLNQLNLSDLEKSLNSGDSTALKLLKLQEPIPPAEWCELIKDVPPLKILSLINSSKAAEISMFLQRVSAAAHFSQSMTDYFAHDDAVEPALAVLCEVLRTGPDVGAVLKNNFTNFLGLAQKYQKLRSAEDHDCTCGTTGVHVQANTREKSKNLARTRQPGSRPKTRYKPGYKLGYCFDFQESVGCNRRKCTFKHLCVECDATEHGRCKCPES